MRRPDVFVMCLAVILGALSGCVGREHELRSATAAHLSSLEAIAVQIADALRAGNRSHPATVVDRMTFGDALSLASSWPHPAFRESIEKLVNSDSETTAVAAICALARYNDKSAHDRLVQCKADSREYNVGCIVHRVGAAAEHLLPEDLRPVAFTPAKRGLLGLEEDCPPAHRSEYRTIPIAVRALSDANRSVRAQASVWLLEHGVMLDNRPLRDAWPYFSHEEKSTVVEHFSRVTIGEREFVAALESFLDERVLYSPLDQLHERILSQLSMRGSDVGVAFARRVIERQAPRAAEIEEFVGESDIDALLPTALKLAILDPAMATVERGRAWSNSDSEWLRAAGLCILARLDDSEAVERVIADVIQNPVASFQFNLNPLDRLADRDWNATATSRRYALATIGACDSNLATTIGSSAARLDYQQVSRIRALLHILSAIAHDDFGPIRHVPSLTNSRQELEQALDAAKAWANRQGW